MHAAHARTAARAARRTSRATFPTGVTENPLSSSDLVARLRVASVTAALSGDLGPSAP